MIIFQTGTFYISIIAYFAFNEKMIPCEVIAMLVCFAGMVTVTVSGTRNAAEDGSDASSANYSRTQLIVGYSLVIVTSWVFAACATLCRALKDISSGIIMFWHGILGVTLATIAILVEYIVSDYGKGQGMHLLNMGSQALVLLLAATVFDTMGVNCATIAYQSDSSGFVALISYVMVVYGFLSDCLIFNESFSWVELSGAACIISVTIVTSIVKLRESKVTPKRSRVDSFTSADF